MTRMLILSHLGANSIYGITFVLNGFFVRKRRHMCLNYNVQIFLSSFGSFYSNPNESK